MGFQKKFECEVSGWGELYPIFLAFWNFFNFAKPLISLQAGSTRLPVEVWRSGQTPTEDSLRADQHVSTTHDGDIVMFSIFTVFCPLDE